MSELNDMPPETPKPTAPKGDDVVLLHSPTADGEGARIVRLRDDRLELGEVRPAVEGKPLSGELVQLKPREATPRICDVEVLYAPERKATAPERATTKGPARVASRAYRENWDSIFQSKSEHRLN